MAERAIGINIPAGAEPNISADDHAALFHALAGGDGELSEITCTRISDNLVRLSAGDILVKGHQLRVPGGSTHELAVESGTLGMNRNDLVVAQYVRRESEEENDTLEFAVVKGTPTAGVASDPELVQEDIDNPAYTTRQIALFRLPIVETTLGTPVKLVNLVDNLARLTAVEGDLANLHNSSALCNLYLYGATTAGNPTYSTQYSEYTRVGDQVDISFHFQLTNLGGMDGGIRVGNLPFESDSTSSASTTQLHVSSITRAGIIAVAAQVVAGSTYALLRIMYETSGTISEGTLAASHMANDSMIKGIISYKAA